MSRDRTGLACSVYSISVHRAMAVIGKMKKLKAENGTNISRRETGRKCRSRSIQSKSPHCIPYRVGPLQRHRVDLIHCKRAASLLQYLSTSRLDFEQYRTCTAPWSGSPWTPAARLDTLPRNSINLAFYWFKNKCIKQRAGSQSHRPLEAFAA